RARAAFSAEKDPLERLQVQREFVQQLLDVLGYEARPGFQCLDDGDTLPVLGGLRNSAGAPLLWILEAVSAVEEQVDPLEATLIPEQFEAVDEDATPIPSDEAFDDIITSRIFTLAEPPRWVLLVSLDSLILI